MQDKYYSTPEGFEIIKNKINNLREQQKEALKDIKNAQSENSDLSENSEYLEAKERLNYIDGELNKMEDKLSKTIVIEPNNNQKTKVIFGCTVKVYDIDQDKEITVKIVGDEESNAKENKLSYLSPFARSIIGKSVGDEATFDLPNGNDRQIKILEII